MSYFSVKAVILDEDGKNKKVNTVCKASSVIIAEATTVLNLGDSLQKITHVDEKNYVNVFSNGAGGEWYDVKIEYSDVDDKLIKELFLQQANDLNLARLSVLALSGVAALEVTAIVKTNIIDYFEEEEM